MNYYEFLHRWNKSAHRARYFFRCRGLSCHWPWGAIEQTVGGVQCPFDAKQYCILLRTYNEHGYYKSWNQIMRLAQGLLKLGVLTK